MFRRFFRGRRSWRGVLLVLLIPIAVFYLSPSLEESSTADDTLGQFDRMEESRKQNMEKRATKEENSREKEENPKTNVKIQPVLPKEKFVNQIDAPGSTRRALGKGRATSGRIIQVDDVTTLCSSEKMTCRAQTNEYWFVNHERRISGCLIPKCGSSTLRRLFFQMGGARDWNDPQMQESRIHALAKSLKRHYHQQKHSPTLPSNYKLFTFTREPFARIVSYYHSKILKMHPYYYKSIIRKILIREDNIKNPPVDVERAKQMGLHATFEGLVKYIVKYFGKDDVHWAPMCSLCQFCSYNYTFFGKLENAAEDFPKLMKYLGFSEDQIPVHTFSTVNASRQTVIDHFKNLKRSDIEKLQQKYITDYQLLNYPLPTSYLPQFQP